MAKAGEHDDRIPFEQWQRHDEAADAYFRTKARGDGSQVFRGNRDSNFVTVKNSSGADRTAGQILEFTGLAITNLEGDVPVLWFTGGSPTLANAFGVLVRAIPNNDFDDCQIAGACEALVNVLDADDQYARVTASTYVLQSCPIGPVRILYKPSGTGEKKCGVLLPGGGATLMLGKTDAAINKGASGTVSIWTGAPGSESDSGADVTAYNRFANVAITRWVMVGSLDNGRMYLIAAEC